MDTKLLDKILNLGEFGTIRALWTHSLLIVVFLTILELGIDKLFNLSDSLSHQVRIYVLATPYVFFLIANLILFLVSRYFTWNMRVARYKANIVLAYNLDGLSAPERFTQTYQGLVKSVQNEIDVRGLGKRIKIIQAPSDIRFKDHTAAEEMTRLGLFGQTLLIWGFVDTSNRGRKTFTTRFSYEFGYTRNSTLDVATAAFQAKINKILSSGLFTPVRMNVSNFSHQITPTALLILGMTTLSLSLFDDAESFLLAFMGHFHEETNLLRKRELGPASIQAEDMLISIYLARLAKSHIDTVKDVDEVKALSEKVIKILPNDYFAHLNLAYICETRGDSANAKEHLRIATLNAPRRMHDHVFDAAYFALVDDKYTRALIEYEKIPDGTSSDTAQISNFLNNKFKKTQNVAFLFGDGYISYRWDDIATGVNRLRKFILSADASKHSVLIQKAEELVRNSGQ